ncbi:MAG: efflux RND transporter permease subunit [Calditrichaceae bacterium]
MSLSSISIRRPVLAMVMSIVIVLFGIIGYNFLGVREYPNVDPPIITVTANYTGANADVIESQITEPLEESISGIAGIRTISSVSRDGRATVTVEFDLGIDLEAAANDVRDRVSRAIRRLPPDADNPIVQKADANASPIVFLNIKSDKRNLLELTDIATNTFKERVQTIPGVSEVQIWGSKTYAMRLWMDPAKLSAYGLTPLDIRNELLRQNVELPSGSVEGSATELTVRTISRLEDVQAFNNLIIKEDDGKIIRFKDIGFAELGPENLRTVLKRDAVPMVGLVLIPQPGANYISIVDEFENRLRQIEKDLPKDITLGIGFDTSKYIRESISEVGQTFMLAFLLVILIIFLFLRDWRTTVIPMITVPISIIGAFFIMYIAEFSINVLTLLGLVLAIGMVVDDAIVMLENIYAKIEQGMPPVAAGIKGSREVFLAIIATTLALIAVFLPVIFLQGLTGRLFREFGIVVAGAVSISSFVALTLTPMLTTKLLKGKTDHSRFYKRTEDFFLQLNKSYRGMLNKFLSRKKWAIIFVLVSFIVIVAFGMILPRELAPLEDRSGVRLFSVAPEGATYEYMDHFMDQVINLIDENVPEKEAIISVTSPGFGSSSSVNSGFIRLILKNPDDRKRSQMEIANQLSSQVKQLSAARTFVSQEQSIGSSRGALPVQYVIEAPNFERLREILPNFLDQARQDPNFQYVDANLKFNKPELRIEIERERAQSLGVSVIDIAQVLQLALSGQRFDYFIMNGKQYQVIGQLARESRDEPLDLRSLYVRNKRGEMVQLDNLVHIYEQSSPPQLYHFNRYVSATVSAGLAPGKTIGEGIAAMDRVAKQVLDESFRTDLAGPSRDFIESASSLEFAFVLALLIIYLVLAAQFESFRDPLIIMFSVPLALGGALFSLWYFGQTLNIFSQIGQIMLIGLVTKNGILIVEFANQRKANGLTVSEAIRDAAAARFRPILMTSLSTILGILPIALALGAGSESRIPMGIAVIGGLIIGTVLSLFIIPAIYLMISKEGAPPLMEMDEKELELITESN